MEGKQKKQPKKSRKQRKKNLFLLFFETNPRLITSQRVKLWFAPKLKSQFWSKGRPIGEKFCDYRKEKKVFYWDNYSFHEDTINEYFDKTTRISWATKLILFSKLAEQTFPNPYIRKRFLRKRTKIERVSVERLCWKKFVFWSMSFMRAILNIRPPP